jgi:hypothetical protein
VQVEGGVISLKKLLRRRELGSLDEKMKEGLRTSDVVLQRWKEEERCHDQTL